MHGGDEGAAAVGDRGPGRKGGCGGVGGDGTKWAAEQKVPNTPTSPHEAPHTSEKGDASV